MSTGLATAASAGSPSARLAWSRGESWTTSRPPASQASAHMIPGPPALVTIPTRRPAGMGWLASSEATSNSSARLSVRITPAWSNRASTVTSEAASRAPVWEEVALAPAAERPLLTASTGLVLATRRAMRANLRGLPNDSRYSSTRSVRSSCSQNESRSLPEMSALLPTDTNDDSPSPRALA